MGDQPLAERPPQRGKATNEEEARIQYEAVTKPCGTYDGVRFIRFGCLGLLRLNSEGHESICQGASLRQGRGAVFEKAMYWRDYFAWQCAHEETGITYANWQATGSPQDALERYGWAAEESGRREYYGIATPQEIATWESSRG